MKKKKILMLTLDERPCNYHYPAMMPKTNCELILPPEEFMSKQKSPANTEKLAEWLLSKVCEADAMILSLDMLIYGGIVPSRLHHNTAEELFKKSDILKEFKRLNPKLKIYAFELIMRCPSVSSDAEEPDYYDICGAEIHKYGKYTHISKLRDLTEEEAQEFEEVKAAIKPEYLEDFIARRKTNLEVLMHNLEYIKDGTVDYFIVPQDDSAVYGFTAMDQVIVREYLKGNLLHRKTAMYPSADDTGLSLLARAVSELNNTKMKVYVHYASSKGALTIPKYEDRIVGETIKYHIMSIGGVQVYTLAEADILLAVNNGSEELLRGEPGWALPYDIERNLAEFVNYIEYALDQKKTVALADIATTNRADYELTELLYKENLHYKIDGYSGWNTSSNTIGTALCQAVLHKIGKDHKGNINFLTHRYYEDIAYMVYVRKYISEEVLPKMNMDIYTIDGVDGEISKMVKKMVHEYMLEHYPSVAEKVESIAVKMPWNRMFETDIKLKLKK